MAPLPAHAARGSRSRSTGQQVRRLAVLDCSPTLGRRLKGGAPIDTAVLAASAFAECLADAGRFAEDAGAAGGVVAVVDLSDAPADGPPAWARRSVRTVPGVVVGLLPPDPSPAAVRWAELADVVLAGASEESHAARAGPAGAPAMAVPVGPDVDGPLARLLESVAARPLAAAALALLLRRPPGSAEDGLVAESAVYSMLQAGPEFAAWRSDRRTSDIRRRPDGSIPPVTVTRDGSQMTVTLARPARHNALDTSMRDALVEALAVAMVDETLTVVLRGDGPSFCSGGDLDDFGTTPDPATAHLVRLTRSPALLAARLGARLEARLHGACIGAGVELAAFAGRVVADSGTFFALPELSFGLIPGSGGTVSLPARIGRHRTAWLAFTGQRISAEHALRWGLVDDIT